MAPAVEGCFSGRDLGRLAALPGFLGIKGEARANLRIEQPFVRAAHLDQWVLRFASDEDALAKRFG